MGLVVLSLIIVTLVFNCHSTVHGGSSTVRLVSRRIPVLLIANINCVSYLATVGACFSSSIILVSRVVVRRDPMFLITHIFHMTSATTELTNGLCGINGNILRFEVDTWSGVTKKLSFLLSHIREDLGNGRYGVHEEDVRERILVYWSFKPRKNCMALSSSFR